MTIIRGARENASWTWELATGETFVSSMYPEPGNIYRRSRVLDFLADSIRWEKESGQGFGSAGALPGAGVPEHFQSRFGRSGMVGEIDQNGVEMLRLCKRWAEQSRLAWATAAAASNAAHTNWRAGLGWEQSLGESYEESKARCAAVSNAAQAAVTLNPSAERAAAEALSRIWELLGETGDCSVEEAHKYSQKEYFERSQYYK